MKMNIQPKLKVKAYSNCIKSCKAPRNVFLELCDLLEREKFLLNTVSTNVGMTGDLCSYSTHDVTLLHSWYQQFSADDPTIMYDSNFFVATGKPHAVDEIIKRLFNFHRLRGYENNKLRSEKMRHNVEIRYYVN